MEKFDNTGTTYTLLITIAHDYGAALSTDLLEEMVRRSLEEGTKDFAGVHAATVSVVLGEHLGTVRVGSQLENVQRQIKKARDLHASLYE